MTPSSTARFARIAGATSLSVAALAAVVSLGCYAPGSAQGNRPAPSANGRLSSPSGRTAFGGSRWHPVEVQSARFRVLMPIRARVKTERQRADDGTPMRIHSAQIEDGRTMLSFVVTDIDRGLVGDPVDLLNGMTRRFLSEVDRFNVISSKEITHQGLIGMAMRSREPEEGLELFSRHLVGRWRTFTLIAAVRAGSVRSAEAMVDYYFRSLSVSPDEGIVPQGAGAMGSAWAYVTPARDDFSVRLPGAPRVTDVTLELDGETIEGREYRVAVPDGSVSFVARVYRFERSIPTRLLEKVEALAVGSGRSVRERSDVQRQGYAGSRLVVARGDAAEHTTYVQTMSRLYEFTVTNPTSREEELAVARRAFNRSIRIH